MIKVLALKNVKGFSLVEAMVFISILSVFFISSMTIVVFILRNMKTQQYKILATRYAEEGIEWVKQEKEDDWQLFSLRDDSGGAGTNYCLNSLDWSTKTDCNDVYSLGPPNIFKRVLVITNFGNPTDRITINLTVSWLENGVEQKIILKSVSNLWE
jgi:type II secretory pathway pseudopilin PulG